MDDYLALPERLGLRQTTDRAAIQAGLTEPVAEAPRPVNPQRTIEAAVGLGPLLPVPKLRLRTGPRVCDPLCAQRWQLVHPQLGVLDAVYAGPHTPERTVLLLHGHGDDERSALRDRGGASLAEAGFGVLVPRIRAYQDGRGEADASWSLLEHGTSLLAAELAEVEAWSQHLDRPVILGHSGGAALAMLHLLRGQLCERLLLDNRTDFSAWADGVLGDESVPALRAHASWMFDRDRSPCPASQLPLDPPPADLLSLL